MPKRKPFEKLVANRLPASSSPAVSSRSSNSSSRSRLPVLDDRDCDFLSNTNNSNGSSLLKPAATRPPAPPLPPGPFTSQTKTPKSSNVSLLVLPLQPTATTTQVAHTAKPKKKDEEASVSSKRGRRGKRRRQRAVADDDAVHNVLAGESFPKARRGLKGRTSSSSKEEFLAKYNKRSSSAMGALPISPLPTIPEEAEDISSEDEPPARTVPPPAKASKMLPTAIVQKSVASSNPLLQTTESTKEATESAEKLSDDMDTDSDEEIVLSPDLLPLQHAPSVPYQTPKQVAKKKAGASFSDPSVGTPAAQMIPGLQQESTLHSHPAGSKAQRAALRQIALGPPSQRKTLSFSSSHRTTTAQSSPTKPAPSVLETLQPPGGALLRKPVSDATLQVYRTCRPDNANVMQAMMAPPPRQEGQSVERATPQSAVHIENVVLPTDRQGTPIVEDDDMSALTLETADERDMWLAKEGQARGAKRPRLEHAKSKTIAETTTTAPSKPLPVRESIPVARRRSTSDKHSKHTVPSPVKPSRGPETTASAADSVVLEKRPPAQSGVIRVAQPLHASPLIDAAAILTRMGSPQDMAGETIAASAEPESTLKAVELRSSFRRQSTTSLDDVVKEGVVASDDDCAQKEDKSLKNKSPPVRLESPEDSTKVSRSPGGSDPLSPPMDNPRSNQDSQSKNLSEMGTPTSPSSLHPLRTWGNKRLYTKEVAGLKNLAPIIRFPNGELYVHPALPPGWQVAMSKSRGKPYYSHPDFGRSFYPPIVLPSEDGITRGDCSPTIVEARGAVSSPVGSESLFEDDSRESISMPSASSGPDTSPTSSQCLDSSAPELSEALTQKDLPGLTEPIHSFDWDSPPRPASESKGNSTSPFRQGQSDSTQKEVTVHERSTMGTVELKTVTTEAIPGAPYTVQFVQAGETAGPDSDISEGGAHTNTYSVEDIEEPKADQGHEEESVTVGRESDKVNGGAGPSTLVADEMVDATMGQVLEEEENFAAGQESDEASGGHDLGSDNEDLTGGDNPVSVEGGVLAHFDDGPAFRLMSHQDEGSMSSLTSCISARARNPPMPLCSLQHLEALEVYKSKSASKKRKKAKNGEWKKAGKRRLS